MVRIGSFSATEGFQRGGDRDSRWTRRTAGNFSSVLPVVWTPPQRLRDDRELVRARIDASDEMTRVKLQILSMLKRRGIAKPAGYGSTWSKRFVAWLLQVAASLDAAVTPVLEGLVARYQLQVAERARLDGAIRTLSQTDRYRAACQELRRLPGVGLISAMTSTHVTGDVNRRPSCAAMRSTFLSSGSCHKARWRRSASSSWPSMAGGSWPSRLPIRSTATERTCSA